MDRWIDRQIVTAEERYIYDVLDRMQALAFSVAPPVLLDIARTAIRELDDYRAGFPSLDSPPPA